MENEQRQYNNKENVDGTEYDLEYEVNSEIHNDIEIWDMRRAGGVVVKGEKRDGELFKGYAALRYHPV